ncbi:MAG: hypothetical protein EOP24_27550 [Hyphomicrobiales bacterium]|nr:MAG: hypothetical protein EOP24_27550 [Hyphomicrobiales bacterium]
MSDCRAGESRETTHERYARLLDLPLEPVGTDDDLTDHYASTPIFADLRAKYAAEELTDAELADAAADAINLTKPVLIFDLDLDPDERPVTLAERDRVLEGVIAELGDDDEPEQPADVVVEQWAWWKKWALILAVGAVLAIIGYGWLVQA